MDPKRERWELLNESEKDFLQPIVAIMGTIMANYSRLTDEESINSKAINDRQNEDFRTLCADQGIDTKRAAAISTKLFNTPWYCYFVTSVATQDDAIFSLCTHKNPEQTILLRPDEYPAFYEAELKTKAGDPDQFYPAILDALHLPHDHKYITVSHYEALATIAEIYTDQGNGILIPRIGGRRIKSIDIPLDKPNSKMWNLWNLPSQVALGGQLAFATEKAGSKKEVSVIYSIDFDELKDTKITKALEPFDKRVYTALAALYNAGNESVTTQQIYNAMGYDGVIGGPNRERINDSITKMAAARVYMDNLQEVQAGYNYPKFKYDGQLLPMERIQAVVNGQFVESVIHILLEPPMISFARGRKQLTTVDRKLLTTPVNKTNTNLAIEDYLLTRISKARTGKAQKKILYNTLYKEANLTTSKKQQRAKPQIEKILKHYISCGFISSYTMEKDGITFTYDTRKLQTKT